MVRQERIGVFVCHCGNNIAGTVDIRRVVEEIGNYPGVVHVEDYMYMCSDPGQELMTNVIREKVLTGVVNANCSPTLHQRTFRRAAETEGLNSYCVEIANIREQCSWPHINNKETATQKAITIIKAAIEKLRLDIALTPTITPLIKKTLVIGAGIAGIQSALDIANGGYEVILVEKETSIGGHAVQLAETFPDMERSDFLLSSKLEAVASHPRIKLLMHSEIEEVLGYVGNFDVKIRQRTTSSEEDQFIVERVGVVVAAPGYELLTLAKLELYPEDPDIIDGLKFERILSTYGLSDGTIRRPSDGRVPREIVFISCVGSRNAEYGVAYCSRICCMYIAKQAVLYRQAVPDGQVYIFYTDIRSDAKGFEEFVQDAMDESGILYLRGEISRVLREGDKIKVWGTDTLLGKEVEISADLVVLAQAMVPRTTTRKLARKLNIASDEYGFLTEAHIKLRPVESLTSGIYLAGTAQWPKDLPDTIASAEAAASKVLSLFSQEKLFHEPTIAYVDTEVCSACEQCVANCTYHAIEIDKKSRVASVNEVLCAGCGSCAAICPSNAVKIRNSTPRQFFEIIDVAVG